MLDDVLRHQQAFCINLRPVAAMAGCRICRPKNLSDCSIATSARAMQALHSASRESDLAIAPCALSKEAVTRAIRTCALDTRPAISENYTTPSVVTYRVEQRVDR